MEWLARGPGPGSTDRPAGPQRAAATQGRGKKEQNNESTHVWNLETFRVPKFRTLAFLSHSLPLAPPIKISYW